MSPGPEENRSSVQTFIRDVVRRHPIRVAVTVVSMTLVGLAQGTAIALLVPLLAVIGLRGDSQSLDDGTLVGWIGKPFEALGVELTLESVLAVFLLFVVAESLLRFFQEKFARRFVGEFGAGLRVSLYDAYLKASWSFWLKKPVGHMASNLTREVERIEGLFSILARFLSSSIATAILLGVAFSLSWQFTLGFLIAGAILVLIMKGLYRSGQRIGTEISNYNSVMYQRVNEQLNAAKAIKSSAMERQSLRIFAEIVHELKEAEIQGSIMSYRIPALFTPLVGVLVCLGLYIALTYLTVSPATALVLLFIFYRISLRTTGLQEAWYKILLGSPAYTKILADLREANQFVEHVPSANTGVCPRLSRSLELENVTFEYVPGLPVIRNACLSIPSGKTVAVVGESGSGKSTLLDFTVGLLVPQVGVIRVDGVDVADIDLNAWRSQIGYVGQETILFNDTIRGNIRWANPQAADQEIEDAARLADASDFISAMPDGYETVIGDRGIRLSGGERQRIALARALVRHPRLLILDEATSSLDALSEKLVQEAIDSLAGQMTIIIVAHRLATVRNAHWIYVLDAGQVVQEGTWEKLTREDGLFHKMWSLQSGVAQAAHLSADS